jgi:hypothetical protein
MKNLSRLIVITLFILSGAVSAEQLSVSEYSIRTQLAIPQAPDAQVSHGPNQTHRVSYQGVGFIYQEGVNGAQWAQLNGPGKSLGDDKVRFSVTPTALFAQDGNAGVGANVNLQLADIVSVNHTSHFGGVERHITMATLAPKSPVSVRAMRVATAKGSVTRVGPSVKLGRTASVWYGVSTDGSPNLLLMTGNVRF